MFHLVTRFSPITTAMVGPGSEFSPESGQPKGTEVHYYSFNIGDYAAHAGHLEPMEDLAYRRLLDQYYLREGPLPADVQVTAKLVRMRSMAADVESVLEEFFTLTELGWTHSRCDAEIEKMQDKQAKARNSYVERSLSDSSTTVQLPTPTPTPTPEGKKEDAPRKRSTPTSVIAQPDDVDQQTWADWLTLRKTKRAPVTETVVAGARREADKAGMPLESFLQVWCRRGSQGLEADWLKPHERQTGHAAPTYAERDEMTGRKWPTDDNRNVIDITPNILEIEQ